MATSGSYDFSSTRDSIITSALRRIGALGDTETLDSVRQAVGIETLNPMIKAFQGIGMPVWATVDQEIAMSLFTSVPLSIGPDADQDQLIKPLKIIQALRKDTDAETDVPMTILPWEDYNLLADKNTEGAPVHLFYHPQRTTGDIYIWPLPDDYWQTNGQLYIRYQRPFQDFDASTDEPDFPVEWHEALILALAVRLAPIYGLAPADRKELKEDAKEALNLAKSFDQEEGSIRFQPALRNF